jgi:predicted ArsR family transcriptional regulator
MSAMRRESAQAADTRRTRECIVEALLERGALTLQQLAEDLGCGVPETYRAIMFLRDAGSVHQRPDGTFRAGRQERGTMYRA